MKSPFPGMDPYLEGHLWQDVHQGLSYVIRKLIAKQLPPNYYTVLATYMAEDDELAHDLGIAYPDVSIASKLDDYVAEPAEAVAYGNSTIKKPPVFTTPTFSIPAFRVKIPVIEIWDKQGNKLVTAIEVLSPVNKRGRGRELYLEKCERLTRNQVNLLEIDLLRRGKRSISDQALANTHYLVVLSIATEREKMVWTMTVRDNLPVLPVPLLPMDENVALDLGEALNIAYEDGMYDRSIRYNEEPPLPAFSEEDRLWMKQLLKSKTEKPV